MYTFCNVYINIFGSSNIYLFFMAKPLEILSSGVLKSDVQRTAGSYPTVTQHPPINLPHPRSSPG
jgi:hypothetical protein